MVLDAMILVFWMLSFKPVFLLLSFTYIKQLFSSSSLSAIRLVSTAYPRLLICLLAISLPACASSSLPFWMLYSACKLRKAGWQHAALTYSFPSLEPVCCSMSSSNCCFFTCIQISQEACQVAWYSHLFKNFSTSTTMQLFIKIQWVSLLLSYFDLIEHPGWTGYCSSINFRRFQPLFLQIFFSLLSLSLIFPLCICWCV